MGSSLLLSLALRAAAPAPLGDQHGAEDSFRISSSGPSVDVERGFCAEVSGSATTANWSRPPHDRPRLSSALYLMERFERPAKWSFLVVRATGRPGDLAPIVLREVLALHRLGYAEKRSASAVTG